MIWKLANAEAKRKIFEECDGDAGGPANGGDQMNAEIHQFSRGNLETNSLFFWHGEEAFMSLIIHLNKHSNTNIKFHCEVQIHCFFPK